MIEPVVISSAPLANFYWNEEVFRCISSGIYGYCWPIWEYYIDCNYVILLCLLDSSSVNLSIRK